MHLCQMPFETESFSGVTLPFRDKFSMSRADILVPNHSICARSLSDDLYLVSLTRPCESSQRIKGRFPHGDLSHPAQAVLKDPKTN